MWHAYRYHACDASGVDADIYGRYAFLRLVRMLTRGDPKRRSSVVYMLGALVYENLGTVGRMVDQEVGDLQKRKQLKIQRAAVVRFVKILL